MRDEDRLVLLLSRGDQPSLVQKESHQILLEPLRWDLVLERALAEETYPLFARNLERLDSSRVPADVRSSLTALRQINALRNTLLAEELARVLSLLAAAGIRVIPLKGVALAESLYGDRTLRVCADLDVLVPRESVAKACEMLLDAGYHHHDGEPADYRQADLFLNSNIAHALARQADGITYLLELHWDLAWRWAKAGHAADDLWAGARPGVVFGVSAYRSSPEWEFLFLVIHATRHRWQGLKWLVDIHTLCVTRSLDWHVIWEGARELGWNKAVSLTLSVCRSLFDTPVADEIPRRPLPRWLNLFPADRVSNDPLTAALLPLRVLSRPSAKLRYLADLTFGPTLVEQRFLSLPTILRFLYYPVRPLRLASKWGGGLFCAAVHGLTSRRN